MANRPNPTLRQRRIGAELRRMREQAGFGGSQLARALGVAPAQVTNMENGKAGISVERLRAIAATCLCANEPLIDALAGIVGERAKAGWWEDYRGALSTDFLEVAELEDDAHRLTTYTITFIPGLLQTEAYASAIFSGALPPLPPHAIEARTTFRMKRQNVVRSGRTRYTVFIHEAALRMQFSGAAVQIEQLESLIRDSELPGLSVRIVPFTVRALPSASENFTYAEGLVPELDTVQSDMVLGCHFFDSPALLERFRSILAKTASDALSEEESREFIRSIKKGMGGKHG
ncbi:helix-turn-helix domain-containing protein [Kitasatospora sp. NPDC054939]